MCKATSKCSCDFPNAAPLLLLRCTKADDDDDDDEVLNGRSALLSD